MLQQVTKPENLIAIPAPRRARKTKADKAAEARLNAFVGAALNRRPINIMDIPKVYKVARGFIAAGFIDAVIAVNLAAYVTSIQVAD